MRNPNGYGTVYELKGNRRKPWVARVTTGRIIVLDADGNPTLQYNRKILGYFATKKEALKHLTAAKMGLIAPKENMTLDDLYTEWMKTKLGKASEKSIDGYTLAYNYLKKYHKANFADLRTAHLQEVIDEVHTTGRSKSVLAKIKSLLMMVYDYGMQNDIVIKNYAEFIQMPKSAKSEKKRFTDIEIKKLEELAATEDMAKLLLVLVYTGFRISELLAITKFNIDMDKKTITGGMKTEAGTDRVVPINNKILPIVKEWYQQEAFVMLDGKALSYENIRKRFNRFKAENGFDSDLTIHSTRHTFASLLASKGVDPVYIQKMMGHSNYSMTANVYTHLDVTNLLKEVNKI